MKKFLLTLVVFLFTLPFAATPKADAQVVVQVGPRYHHHYYHHRYYHHRYYHHHCYHC
jgi:hypothetical protein